MKNINPEREKQIITTVLSNTTDEEQVALSNWAAQLLAIRNSSYSNVTKGKEAIRITAQSRIVVPIVKVRAKELKLDQSDVSKIDTSSYKQALKSIRKFWKNRSLPVKLFVGAGTLAAIIFGSQGAGRFLCW